MKNSMVFSFLLAVSLVSVMSASATMITIPGGVGGMPSYGGEYVGPIGADVNGSAIAGGITCVDFNSITYVPNTTGFAVTVETLSPVNLGSARFLHNKSSQLFTYEEAAWLNTQIHLASNQSQVGAIQFAMWELFASNPVNNLTGAQQNLVNAWLDKAAVINPSLYDFSSVEIYTPVDPTQNQEFISGCAVPVPEPGTMMLFGLGMFVLAIYGKRRAIRKESL